MNNTFNLTRFGWYFKKHTIDHGRTYLISLAVAIGIVFVGLGLTGLIGTGWLSQGYQYGMYLFLIWLGGSIFTSTIFSDLGDRKKATLPLTLPVSALERFLVAWLYTCPIFLLVATCCFFGVDALVLSMSHSRIIQNPNKMLDLLSIETPGAFALVMFAVFQIVCFWGAIYFNSLHFIKTAFVFFIVFLGASLINKIVMWLISGGSFSSNSLFFQSDIYVNGNSYGLTLGSGPYIVNWAIFGLIIILLLTSTFYKLKEKQV